MKNPIALERISENNVFRKGDVFVLFGELFGRGYATGLVEEARKAGMEIVGITVGRRDENNLLRPLNADELSAAEARLGGRIINVPLMAGFDLDAPVGGLTPSDLLSKMTLESWEAEKLDWSYIEDCQFSTAWYRLVGMYFSPTPWPAASRRRRCSLFWPTASTREQGPAICRRRPCSTATWVS
jgi:hypothetical protein